MIRLSQSPRASRMRALPFLVVAAGVLALAGCGGEGSPAPVPAPPSDQMSAAVMSSVQSLTAFAQAQPSTDTAEPLKLDNVGMAPVSDTLEPVALN